MKKQILFVHSAGPQGMNEGSSNLVAWLKKELGDNYEILYPIMPQPEDPSYERWKDKLEKVISVLENNFILVGHSLGGSVALKYLSENKIQKKPQGLFLVATPWWGEQGWGFGLKKDFTSTLPSLKNIFIYHSVNDDVIPFEHAKIYAEKLSGAVLKTIEGDEHAFDRGLPALVDDLRNLSKQVCRILPR